MVGSADGVFTQKTLLAPTTFSLGLETAFICKDPINSIVFTRSNMCVVLIWWLKRFLSSFWKILGGLNFN